MPAVTDRATRFFAAAWRRHHIGSCAEVNELLTRPSCRSKRQIPVKNWNRVACDLLSSGGSGSGGSDWGVKPRSFTAHP